MVLLHNVCLAPETDPKSSISLGLHHDLKHGEFTGVTFSQVETSHASCLVVIHGNTLCCIAKNGLDIKNSE